MVKFINTDSFSKIFSTYDLDLRIAELKPSEKFDDDSIIYIDDPEQGNWVYAQGHLFGCDYDIKEISEFLFNHHERLSKHDDKFAYIEELLNQKLETFNETLNDFSKEITVSRQTLVSVLGSINLDDKEIDLGSYGSGFVTTNDEYFNDLFFKYHKQYDDEIITAKEFMANITMITPVIVLLYANLNDFDNTNIVYYKGKSNLTTGFLVSCSLDGEKITLHLFLKEYETVLTREYDHIYRKFEKYKSINPEHIIVESVLAELCTTQRVDRMWEGVDMDRVDWSIYISDAETINYGFDSDEQTAFDEGYSIAESHVIAENMKSPYYDYFNDTVLDEHLYEIWELGVDSYNAYKEGLIAGVNSVISEINNPYNNGTIPYEYYEKGFRLGYGSKEMVYQQGFYVGSTYETDNYNNILDQSPYKTVYPDEFVDPRNARWLEGAAAGWQENINNPVNAEDEE